MAFADQWRRVQRWLERIEATPKSSTEYDDFIWAFFQNCWHLKDWIKNDQGLSSHFRRGVERLALSERSLRVCADLANGTKHFELQKPKDGPGARHSHRVLRVVAGDSSKTEIDYFLVLGDGSQVNALTIAREAVEAWRRLLTAEGLLV
jgi:hypothetical protein